MLEGRSIEMFVVDKSKTKGMTKEEKREYYRALFANEERMRLETLRGE
jgi:hypothetical protein